MMYPYMTLADNTEIVHYHIIDEDGIQKAIVHFERPTEKGVDSARCELPSYKWLYQSGYSDEDIQLYEQLYINMLLVGCQNCLVQWGMMLLYTMVQI